MQHPVKNGRVGNCFFGLKHQKKLTLDGAWKIFYITFRVALIERGLSTDTTFDLTPFSLDDILNPFVSTFQVLAAF